MTRSHPFLWLSSIPLCICTTPSFPSADSLLGRLPVLLLQIVLQWVLGHVCLFESRFSQGTHPAVGVLGHMLVLFLVTVLHSDWVNLHSHQEYRRAPFSSHPLQYLPLVDVFGHGSSDWCELIPHRSFDLCFSDNEWRWTYFQGRNTDADVESRLVHMGRGRVSWTGRVAFTCTRGRV